MIWRTCGMGTWHWCQGLQNTSLRLLRWFSAPSLLWWSPSVASSQVRTVHWVMSAYVISVCWRALCLRGAACRCMPSGQHMPCAPRLAAACNSRRCTHSFVSLPTAQPCLQTALEAAEAAARAVAEAEEAAALATRLMDAANRYEQQAQDFGHHHHPEGHVSPLDFAEVLCC